MTEALPQTILIVDDEPSYRTLLFTILTDAGYEVLQAIDGPQALEITGRRSIDAAVVDLMMPNMDGRDLMKRLLKRDPHLPVVFLTAYGSIPSAVEAIREGAADYLTKPLPHVNDLLQTLARVLEKRRLLEQNRRLVETMTDPEPFPAADPITLELLDKARRVAGTDVTVLICGESGTGKERLARFLHQNSLRKGFPMVSLNCAAIVGSLMESELFGHEKGAFTGATDRRIGRFEEAHRSTLFLDEIGELSLPLQPKLLRALQERECQRVGGSRTIRFDTRLIAATNRDLDQEIRAGRFREDLFYRLSVVTLTIPPLRERPGDIGFLAERFIRAAADRFGKTAPELAPATRTRLEAYRWPGNTREMANLLEASVLLADGPVLEPDDLHGLGASPPSGPLEENPLVGAERKALLDALDRHGGNRAQTAAFLGMSIRNLLYKLKKHGINRSDRGDGTG